MNYRIIEIKLMSSLQKVGGALPRPESGLLPNAWK